MYVLLLPTYAGVNSDGQMCSKNNAVFLPPPVKKKRQMVRRKMLVDILFQCVSEHVFVCCLLVSVCESVFGCVVVHLYRDKKLSLLI